MKSISLSFKILAILVVMSLLIPGCVKKEEISKSKQISTPTQPEISKTEKGEGKNLTVIQNSKQKELLHSLKVPSGVEYEWIDLNDTLGLITVNNTTYETGIFGKMYVPKEIKPDTTYPIYLLLSRNPEVSEIALFGLSVCISPSFVLDVLNKRADLYLHLGGGGVVFGKYFFDRIYRHYFLKNIYSKSGFNISCEFDNKLYQMKLSELKPGGVAGLQD